jgi:2-hydroxy-3-oxopropionate reductase
MHSTVFDIDAAKVAQLRREGRAVAASPADATACLRFRHSQPQSCGHRKKAVFGTGGIAEAADASKLLIDMSSIDPAATAEMAQRLKDQTGMAWVDCPLSGGVPGATAGKLTIMAGGDETDFERAHAVMKDLSANYTLMGGIRCRPDHEAGEPVVLRTGLPGRGRSGEAGGSWRRRSGAHSRRRSPAAAPMAASCRSSWQSSPRAISRPTGSLGNMLKDLDSIQAFALKTKTPMPLTSAVSSRSTACSVAMGLGPRTAPRPCGCSTDGK